MQASTRPRGGCGPAVIQIQVDPPRQLCVRCGKLLIEPQFLGRFGDTWHWKAFRGCGTCRRHKYRLRTGRALPNAVPTGRPRLRPGERLDQVAAAAEMVVRERRRRLFPGTAYREDGQSRCPSCGATIYCEMTIIRGGANHPSGYFIEWLCWGGGHVVKERWYGGSPIRRRFPVARAAPRPVVPKVAPIIRPAPPTRSPRAVGRRPTMRVVQQDNQMQAGCDERCRLLQYVDPEDPKSPTYITRLHSPDAHNEYGAGSRRAAPPAIAWNGLYVDGGEYVVTVDGRPPTRPLTRIEWLLLQAMLRDFGRVVLQEVLIKRTWGDEYSMRDAHLLRVHMARLRKKLDADPGRFITTQPSIGYGIGVAGLDASSRDDALAVGASG